MRGGVAAYGRPGCGQADATTRNNIVFQLGCWEMQHNPYGMSEEGVWAQFGHNVANLGSLGSMISSDISFLYFGTVFDSI